MSQLKFLYGKQDLWNQTRSWIKPWFQCDSESHQWKSIVLDSSDVIYIYYVLRKCNKFTSPVLEENLSTRKIMSGDTYYSRKSCPAKQDILSASGPDAPCHLNHHNQIKTRLWVLSTHLSKFQITHLWWFSTLRWWNGAKKMEFPAMKKSEKMSIPLFP